MITPELGGAPDARCRSKDDNGTRALLEKLLTEEEEHVDWLESQLGQIEDVALAKYQAGQMHA